MKVYHNPPHIYIDNTVYFITSHTCDEKFYLDTDEKKEILLNEINKNVERYQFELFSWIILDNHYHLLIKVNQGNNLGKFINMVHGSSSYRINKIDNYEKRKVWYSYWDRCIRNEKEFYTSLNYIHHNPIKHGRIDNLDHLQQYIFSSYPIYLKEKGKDWINDIFLKFPVIDYTINEPKGSTPNDPEGSIPNNEMKVSTTDNDPKGSTPKSTTGSTPGLGALAPLINERLDLRGVSCPLNYVKTKMKLETMDTGQVLEILLDDGDPIVNVPRSAKDDGNKILRVEPREDYYSVIIKKGG